MASVTKLVESFSVFEPLDDPRAPNSLHPLLSLIAIAVCATVAGCDSYVDIERFAQIRRRWFAEFLDLPLGIPSHDTFSRVFARLDTAQFFLCVQRWLSTVGEPLAGQTVAIDGKTLRGSFDAAAGRSPLHLVSAWACGQRLSLGQIAVDHKSNEITAVPQLLELLDLQGAVVTLDAMHCQRETAQAIVAREADYVITLKDNQPTLLADVSTHFIDLAERDYAPTEVKRHKTVEKGHGRLERREYYVCPLPESLRRKHRWHGLRTIGMVYRERTIREKLQTETSYFISSLPARVRAIAKHVRDHWGIENRLHWTLDVTFSEDRSRIRKGDGPEIASTLRRLALSILQQDTTLKESMRGKRLMAGWDEQVLARLLLGFGR
jgi:predicted transposase YbfD/YdcC